LSPPEPRTVKVAHEADARHAEDAAAELAGALCFDPTAVAELRLAARELAVNLLRHAGGGRMTFSAEQQDGRRQHQDPGREAPATERRTALPGTIRRRAGRSVRHEPR